MGGKKVRTCFVLIGAYLNEPAMLFFCFPDFTIPFVEILIFIELC